MATFKVIGKGEDGKYFDDLALNNVINYVLNPEKTKSHLVGAYGVQIEFAAQQMEFVSRARVLCKPLSDNFRYSRRCRSSARPLCYESGVVSGRQEIFRV